MLNDLAKAFRQWMRTPVVTAVALASLGLGIGANVALFGIVDALLLKSLPVRDPQTLVRFAFDEPEHGPIDLSISTRVWSYLRDRQPFAESVLVYANARVNLARGGEARFVPAIYLSGTGMTVLGIEPVMGRALLPEDDLETATPSVVISYGLWQRDFAGSAGALGQSLWVTNQPFTIVGVAPARFFGLEVGQSADVFLPLAADTHVRRVQGNTLRPDSAWLTLYARLRPGQDADDVTAAFRSWLPDLREATRPPGRDGERHFAQPPYAVSGAHGISYLRMQYEKPLEVLLGAVALVLIIACANLAALVLARATDRRHELGVRLALGAGRARLIRMLVAESLLLATGGALLGVVIAQGLTAAMVPYMALPSGPPALPVALDLRLLAFTGLVALVSGAMAGLLPALRASRVTPQVSLASSGRVGMQGKTATRNMRVMVAAQVALSLTLVAGAALMVRSFVGLTTNPTGVDVDRVLIAIVSGSLTGPDAMRRYDTVEEVRQVLRTIPGVESVSGGRITPLSSGMAGAQIVVPGSIYQAGSNEVFMNGAAFTPFNHVLPTYFATVGTPIVVGRDFDDRDRPGSPGVAIVNQAFVLRHFGEANPLGRTLIASGETLEIIGVAADSKTISLKESRTVAMGFGAFTQIKSNAPIPVLRFALRGDQPNSLRLAAASAIRNVDPRLSIEFRTMRDEADATINRERLMAWLAGIFAALGLLMAVIGLYGTFTYAVARRRGEIGVRMALGAASADILTMVLREAGIVLAIGTAFGVAGALASGRLLQGLLVGTSPRDPWMLSIAITGVVGAALLASLVPARRASRIDPMAALREE